jgi:TRAP-type C4-dicarboxylate transport system permease small subunit
MLRSLHKGLGKVEAVVAAAFLIVMVGLIFYGGIARLLAHPQNWTIDLSTCLFAWACFLCADLAWRRSSLMSITLLTERLPAGAQRVLTHVNYAIIAAFLVYVIYAGTWLSWISRARSFQGIPDVSYSWITMSLPVGAALLLLTTAIKVADEIADGRPAAAIAPAGNGER